MRIHPALRAAFALMLAFAALADANFAVASVKHIRGNYHFSAHGTSVKHALHAH